MGYPQILGLKIARLIEAYSTCKPYYLIMKRDQFSHDVDSIQQMAHEVLIQQAWYIDQMFDVGLASQTMVHHQTNIRSM